MIGAPYLRDRSVRTFSLRDCLFIAGASLAEPFRSSPSELGRLTERAKWRFSWQI